MEPSIYELAFRLSGAAFAIPLYAWLFFELQEVPHKKAFLATWTALYVVAIFTRDIAPMELDLILALLIYAVAPLLFGTGKISKRLLKIILLDTIFFAEDAFSGAVYVLVFGVSPIDQLTTWSGTFHAIAYFLLCFIVLLVPAALVIRSVSKHENISGDASMPIIALATFQFALILSAICFQGNSFTSAEMAIPMSICLIANLVLDVMLFALIAEFQRADERDSKQKRLNDTVALVQGSLDDMETISFQLHRIRHDIANQIQIIPVLLENGDRESAAKHLDELSETINSEIPADISGRVESALATIDIWSNALSQDENSSIMSTPSNSGESTAFKKLIETLRNNKAAFNAVCVVLYLATIANALLSTCFASASIPLVSIACVASFAICLLVHTSLVRSFHKTKKTLDERSIAALEENEYRARQSIKGQAYANVKLRERLLKTIQHARELLEENAGEEAINRQLAYGINQIDSALTKQTGNAILDAALEAKRQQLGLQNIEIEVSGGIAEQPVINNVELAAIAFNMIDNATNGIVRLRKENGSRHLTGNSSGGTNERAERITVTLRNFSGELIIETKNHCTGLPNGIIKPNTVHKLEGQTLEHGWGMEIIQLIAERNNGIASFEVRDGMFESTVMIPCR